MQSRQCLIVRTPRPLQRRECIQRLDRALVVGADGALLDLEGEGEEPLYGKYYLPRKFKTVVAVPPHNDVDVFAQDLGFIAIVQDKAVVGWNVTVGGGMGMTHGEPDTFPRTADVLGFCRPEHAIDVAEKILNAYGILTKIRTLLFGEAFCTSPAPELVE